MLQTILASLYWNPNRFIFTVPIIDRPIAWYGFFFVIGFIIGYFMMIRMLRRDLQYTQYLAERDIESWPKLFTVLQGPIENMSEEQKILFNSLPKKVRDKVIHFDLSEEIPQSLKDQILDSFNETMSSPDNNIDRENVDTFFKKAIYSLKDLAVQLTDRLTWFIIAGTIIGARLGHVLFYDWPRYKDHPIDILKIWEGGLASHGGAIGVLIAIWLFLRYTRPSFPELSLITLLDKVVVPTALVAFFIRIGNFFNQEIVGTRSDLPWAVTFGNPFDAPGNFPRHPAQLYEAFSYLAIFILLLWLWNTRGEKLKKGFLTGLFFVLVFTARFFIEFVKVHQGMMFDESILQTGQYLSIPFIAVGLWLMTRRNPIHNPG